MAVNVVTGRAGEAHITSDDEKARNAEIFGKDRFVFDVGGRLWATRVGSTNTIEISDGMCMAYGTQMGIEPWDSESVTIESGAVGFKRHDFICMRYERDTVNDVETASVVVVKGDSAQQNPVDPVLKLNDNDILAGGIIDDTPLFRVVLNGTDITAIEPVYKLRTGYKPTDPNDPTVVPEPDDTNSLCITAAVIDRLWGSSIEDGDAEVYNG